jgi:hypothetical protein
MLTSTRILLLDARKAGGQRRQGRKTEGKDAGRILSRREKSIIAMLCSIENTENKELRTTSAQLEKLLTPLLDLQHNLPFGRE